MSTIATMLTTDTQKTTAAARVSPFFRARADDANATAAVNATKAASHIHSGAALLYAPQSFSGLVPKGTTARSTAQPKRSAAAATGTNQDRSPCSGRCLSPTGACVSTCQECLFSSASAPETSKPLP